MIAVSDAQTACPKNGTIRATPYDRPVDYLLDLAREVVARLGEARTRHHAICGSEEPATDTVIVRPDASQLDLLAHGEFIPMQREDPSSAMVSLAMIASQHDLETAAWSALVKLTSSRRQQRTAMTPPGHPAHRFAMVTAGLDAFEVAIAGLLVCHQVPGLLGGAPGRAGVRLTPLIEVGEAIDLLISDPGDRLEALDRFRPGAPLFQAGVLTPDGNRFGEPIRRRDLVPARVFLDECLGLRLDHLLEMEGLRILHPALRLADVILDPAVTAELAALDLPGAVQRGLDHAIGLLLHGPSGTGKTMLAQAIAGEAGRPLLLLDGSVLSAADDGEATASLLSSVLRRAAHERAVVFIDEVDDLAGEGTPASRSLLAGLERFSCLVILATNQPLRLDPAMDRRLQIKLQLDVPGPSERARILARELQEARVVLDATDVEVAANLTSIYPMSGGWWKNAVQLSVMRASLRKAVPGTISGADLAETTKGLVCAMNASCWREATWVQTTQPLSEEMLGVDLSVRARRLADSLVACRRAPNGQPFGCLVVLTGPEPRVAQELASGIAHHLNLPLVLIDADEALGTKHNGEDARAGRKIYLTRNAPAAIQAVSFLAPDADDLARWEAILARIPSTRHLLVLHAPGPGLPARIRDSAATVLPWAYLTPAARQMYWERLSGQGDAPAVETLVEMRIAAARALLGDLSNAGERTLLP